MARFFGALHLRRLLQPASKERASSRSSEVLLVVVQEWHSSSHHKEYRSNTTFNAVLCSASHACFLHLRKYPDVSGAQRGAPTALLGHFPPSAGCLSVPPRPPGRFERKGRIPCVDYAPEAFPDRSARLLQEQFRFELVHQSRHSGARAGILHTPHGSIETPSFVPVGTNAVLKGLEPSVQNQQLDPQLMFCNTYHLMLQPGAETVRAHGGLHRFMGGYEGPLITDSGG
eukprot:CAMPEP_0174245870 /NCGR_PEP_ID=MMETSP0417-20130205/41049_1 /TAXON_ID=242541 /ORGANISM="Mayorella sp, Strain BSH-02190019" /LENGTH=228 /DNA_ID=CAMNT_0015325695 /DNA_START=25 /DNA_END=708 /DNA_ORIENTATION=-